MNRTTTRRAFLGDALKLGASAAVLGAAASNLGGATESASRRAVRSLPTALPGLPTRAFVDHDGSARLPAEKRGTGFATDRVLVSLKEEAGAIEVRVHCPSAPLARVALRWELDLPEDALYMGDAWERSYGDLQWRFLQPERVLPWYFAAHQEPSGRTLLAGVKTQPSALCFWTVDGHGVTLWLDFRNGGSPSLPGDREIAAATIVSGASEPGETPLAALTRFCRRMCPSPRLPSAPVCGNNNWYYAYGRNFDADAMRRDAGFLADLAGEHKNRPYCVIDAGWNPGGVCPGGPWTAGDPKTFPDLPGLAADMKKLGVLPGIWMRPTALSTVDNPRRLRGGPGIGREKPLDLTLPENLQLIREDVARVQSWGYDLIKHDYSTYDLFGRWGVDMGAELTNAGWHFADQSLTNAEILLRVYRTIREAAGSAVLIGCNSIGHLGAGLFEVQRTGDDTSGRAWERTRRMGVNTLAYRLPQHATFFACDPDCAPHTVNTPWELDRQFLDLIARSGTALFVSVDPRTVTPEQKAAFRSAMQVALSGGARGGSEPLDWLHNTAPTRWRFGDDTVSYNWSEPMGASPFKA